MRMHCYITYIKFTTELTTPSGDQCPSTEQGLGSLKIQSPKKGRSHILHPPHAKKELRGCFSYQPES